MINNIQFDYDKLIELKAILEKLPYVEVVGMIGYINAQIQRAFDIGFDARTE